MKLNLFSETALRITSIAFVAINLGASDIPKTALSFPALPQGLTSFGAEVLGGAVYVYGGHVGKAHDYSVETTLGDFLRLDLDGGRHWEKLAGGSRAQGTRLVAYQGSLYRIGGLQARERADGSVALHSLPEFARYDVQANKWEPLVPMPNGRSSHEATIVGSKIFVGGGWTMSGRTSGGKWSDSMLVIDLEAEELAWQALPQPFQRRAIASDTVRGKVYFIGGMDADGDPSREVDVYDIRTGTWSEGPLIPSGPMQGFGSAACHLDGALLLSSYKGVIVRLSDDGTEWDSVGRLAEKRFFHRITPLPHGGLLAIAGASRKAGHLASLESISLGQ